MLWILKTTYVVDTSYEYPQHIFLEEIKKNHTFLMKKRHIWSHLVFFFCFFFQHKARCLMHIFGAASRSSDSTYILTSFFVIRTSCVQVYLSVMDVFKLLFRL